MKTTIDMARESWIDVYGLGHDRAKFIDALKNFESLVRADERNRTWTQDHWTEYERSIANQAVTTEQKRIVNLLMIQHEAAKGTHNYWHVAANLIQADVASDT
jgi:hypothetical protein